MSLKFANTADENNFKYKKLGFKTRISMSKPNYASMRLSIQRISQYFK